MINSHVAGTSKRYLVFTVRQTQYAVPLSEVKEVIALPKFVSLPNSPDYFLGITNLRGQVISTINLKCIMGGNKGSDSATRASVILTVVEDISVGFAVDSVSEVLVLSTNDIEKAISENTENSFVKGIAHIKDREMILLIDLKDLASSKKINFTNILKVS